MGTHYVINDFKSRLMWQQSGTINNIKFSAVQSYIDSLNNSKFYGHSDWRLPTLEEAMTILQKSKNLYRHSSPLFDSKQIWIWTSDQFNKSYVWIVHFRDGYCKTHPIEGIAWVRAVRKFR
jgi:hypothetical protein